MSRGFSPLERRVILALVSLMRDRQQDSEQPGDDYWEYVSLPLAAVYERCYVLDPGKSWELQRRNQRQSMRRALGRLLDSGYVDALALGWCTVREAEWIDWQGGGKQLRDGIFRSKTPNWRLVSLSSDGLKLALLLERETEETTP